MNVYPFCMTNECQDDFFMLSGVDFRAAIPWAETCFLAIWPDFYLFGL